MNDALNHSYNGEIQELGLKHKTETELLADLLEFGRDWTEEQRQVVNDAYTIAGIVHAEDTYKDEPYIMHVLRVASRIAGYLHIDDPEMIAAALLHDSVEDRPRELLGLIRAAGIKQAIQVPETASPVELQSLALRHLSSQFSPRVAGMVASVTNAPKIQGRQETYEEWLERYAQKVESAARTSEGWAIKFCDWCDNGLGIIYSDKPEGSEEREHFKRKYGLALPILEARFQDADVLALLDPQAQAHVARQFTYGHLRLTA